MTQGCGKVWIEENNILVLRGRVLLFSSTRVRFSVCDLVPTTHARLFVHQPATSYNEMGFNIFHPLISPSCKYLTVWMEIYTWGKYLFKHEVQNCFFQLEYPIRYIAPPAEGQGWAGIHAYHPAGQLGGEIGREGSNWYLDERLLIH